MSFQALQLQQSLHATTALPLCCKLQISFLLQRMCLCVFPMLCRLLEFERLCLSCQMISLFFGLHLIFVLCCPFSFVVHQRCPFFVVVIAAQCHTDVQNFDVATSEATAKEFMNVALGFDETQYGEHSTCDDQLTPVVFSRHNFFVALML